MVTPGDESLLTLHPADAGASIFWRARIAGGRLPLIATLHDPAVIRELRAPGDGPLGAELQPRPARFLIGLRGREGRRRAGAASVLFLLSRAGLFAA